MTPDQVYHRLCDEAVLKTKGGVRTTKAEPAGVRVETDGTVRGRDKDGNPISLPMRVKGKSLAARLNEQAEEKERAEKAERKKVRNGN